MSYAPFEMRVFPIFIYYIILSVFGIFITFKMFIKWRERKGSIPLHLLLAFIFLTLSIISLTIGLTEAVITGYYKEIYKFTLPLAYCLALIANIFLFIFASRITEKGKKAIVPLTIIASILIVFLFLPWNWWGVPREDYVGQPNIRLYSTLSFVIYSISIYIYLAIICYKYKKKLDEKIVRVGLSLLFYSMISMICFYIMNICDTLLITLFADPGYTVFAYIAWIFVVLFSILIYLSLVMPDWMVKWIEKRNKK